MNDNIITKDEAIDRMKAGLPCETCHPDCVTWFTAKWVDFDVSGAQFRKPPEPRRVAREWKNVQRIIYQTGQWSGRETDESIHVREVLPGDVVLQRMTEKEWRSEMRRIGFMDAPHSMQGDICIYFARALGLIGEGS